MPWPSAPTGGESGGAAAIGKRRETPPASTEGPGESGTAGPIGNGGNRRPPQPKGASSEGEGAVSQRAPVSVTSAKSSSRTPHSP